MFERKTSCDSISVGFCSVGDSMCWNGACKSSTPVSGTIEFTSVVPSQPLKVAGKSDNRVVMFDIIEVWSGDIDGTATVEAKWIVHNAPLSKPDAWVNAHAIITFTDVAVLGISGTLTVKLDLSGTEGHWTIMEGTGGLANVHGQGTASTVIMAYSGRVHFDP